MTRPKQENRKASPKRRNPLWELLLFMAVLVACFLWIRGCQSATDEPAVTQGEAEGYPGINVIDAGAARTQLVASPARAPRLPARAFFAEPLRQAFKISPNGKWVSYLERWEGRNNLHVQKIGSEFHNRITGIRDRDVHSYFWANDDRLILMIDPDGRENWQFYGVGRNGGDFKRLTPNLETRTYLIDTLDLDTQSILVGMNLKTPAFFDAYRMNIYNGSIEIVEENPGNVSAWHTDYNGVIRATTGSGLRYRNDAYSPWVSYPDGSPANQSAPLFFDSENQDLYVASSFERDKLGFFKLDTYTGQFKETVFEHPEVDLHELDYSQRRKTPTAARYHLDKEVVQVLDDAHGSLLSAIGGRIGGTDFKIVDQSENEQILLVQTLSDRSHGKCYYYDTKEEHLELIYDYSPWLDEKYMTRMEPISYQGRDGFTIHGYLTLPIGSGRRDLPTIIYPHGGPWTRNIWAYDPTVQFFANRGYAVLQMNFRGSAGFGKRFLEAGNKQWGFAMQDDVTDGVLMLIENGIADPDRIAIFGASYGGYAALAGLTFTPEIYQAGIMVSGISNILSLFDELPPYWKPYEGQLRRRVGHPVNDRELLEAASPVFHANEIRSPLLIAHGLNDIRTVYGQATQMMEALDAERKPYEFIEFEAEGHQFRNMENLEQFYQSVEAFLEKHMQ